MVEIKLSDTPLETYSIRDVPIYVKREDKCWPFPALSKARGVWRAIENRPGASLAVVDTARSLNGQLVATIGMTLGRKVLCGYPVYKGRPKDYLPGPTHALVSLKAELIPIQANRQFVMRAAMAREVAQRKGEWFLFPTGLRLPETVEAVEEVGMKMDLSPGTIIVPSGTGTHLAGLIRAFADCGSEFIATLGYHRNEKRFRGDVARAAGVVLPESRLRIVNTESDYYNVRPELMPPFPAHLHYECRTWNWLVKDGKIEAMKPPVLFWNIGA